MGSRFNLKKWFVSWLSLSGSQRNPQSSSLPLRMLYATDVSFLLWYSLGGLPGHFCMCFGSGQSGPLLYATAFACQAWPFVSNCEHYSPVQVMPKSMPTMKSGCHASVDIVQEVSRNTLYWLLDIQICSRDTAAETPLCQEKLDCWTAGESQSTGKHKPQPDARFQLQSATSFRRHERTARLWSWHCKPQ
jgi:hypothetical protein